MSCTVINLSNPIISIIPDIVESQKLSEKASTKSMSSSKEPGTSNSNQICKKVASPKPAVLKAKKVKEETGLLARFKGELGKVVKAGSTFVIKHKAVIGTVLAALGTTAVAIAKVNMSKISSESTNSDDCIQPNIPISNDDDDVAENCDSESVLETDDDNTVDELSVSSEVSTDKVVDVEPIDQENDNSSNSYERSYTPNDVPAGGQHYHYKDGSVQWKAKGPYSRGKRKSDE